jgi:hypothetical protein
VNAVICGNADFSELLFASFSVIIAILSASSGLLFNFGLPHEAQQRIRTDNKSVKRRLGWFIIIQDLFS